MDGIETWIGREETTEDIIAAAPLAGLAALLDYPAPPWPDGETPPLGHWLSFLPRARQSEIDSDGHPRRGGFLPPVDLPRRMWAGGEVQFLAPLTCGVPATRRSTIRDVRAKTGSTGRLVFVTVDHEASSGGRVCVIERQDLVYREAATTATAAPAPAAPPPARAALVERSMTADPVMLFRFSALTFNSHRIHYDRDYARDVEGYDGLVVHGPLVATLLMDHLSRHRPDARVERFSFRGVRPLLDTAPFTLCLADTDQGASLWCRDAAGFETMTAEAQLGR